MSKGSRDRKCHLGIDVTVWSSEGAWLWLLIKANGQGATIGASANEAQATRDACLSIEEKLTAFDGTQESGKH